ACLASVSAAARHPGLRDEPVLVVVALDRCRDGTARIASAFGARTVTLRHGNAGSARRLAADVAIAQGARWLASTDADSTVPHDWLQGQLACDADAFCGMVRVEDWAGYPPRVARRYRELNPVRDGHPHVHGANLGCDASWYLRCGGFAPLPAHEDVALVDALARAGARIARRAAPVVTTSARPRGRAPDGFAGYLLRVAQEVGP
ncbi:MAG TPA: glycosyltransferase, partial [Dokdonella sp.]